MSFDGQNAGMVLLGKSERTFRGDGGRLNVPGGLQLLEIASVVVTKPDT